MAGESCPIDISAPPELLTPKFMVEFEYYWSRLSAGMEYLVDQEKLDAMKTAALEKEQLFYRKVYSATDSVCQRHEGTIACVFDIDWTIGEVKDDDSDILHTILRPSVVPLVTDLAVRYPERLRFGLLSDRPEESLREEMNHPTFLAPVRAFIDPKLVCSSGMASKKDPYHPDRFRPELLATMLAELNGLVEDQVLEQTLSGERWVYDWYDAKLHMIRNYMQAQPEHAVVVIDNLPYAGLLAPTNPRVTGVDVGHLRQMLIPGMR